MKLQINKKEMSSLFNKAKWTFSLTEEEFLYLKNLLNKIFPMEFTMVLQLLVYVRNQLKET